MSSFLLVKDYKVEQKLKTLISAITDQEVEVFLVHQAVDEFRHFTDGATLLR